MNHITVSGALLSLAFAGAAVVPASAQTSDRPSYATSEETVHGRIETIVDKYHLTLNDDRGFVDDITLRDGTVINPTGLSLAPGEPVTIYGHAEGHTFAASQIDTPEQQPDAGPYQGDDGDAYAPAPYVAADPYGYGAYGPYGYGYPSIGIGFYGGYGYGYGGYGYGGHGYGGHGYGGHGYRQGYGGSGYGHGGGYSARGGYSGSSRGSAGSRGSFGSGSAAGGHGGGRR